MSASNSSILSGANLLSMGVDTIEVACPKDGESVEEAYLRAIASEVFLRLEGEVSTRHNVYASNGRKQFSCFIPAHYPKKVF